MTNTYHILYIYVYIRQIYLRQMYLRQMYITYMHIYVCIYMYANICIYQNVAYIDIYKSQTNVYKTNMYHIYAYVCI